VSVERRTAQIRHAYLGRGAVQQLASVTADHATALLLVTPSLSQADEWRLRTYIDSDVVAVVRPRGGTADVVATTRAAVDDAAPGIVVAAGGGTIMDIAKAVARPGPPKLALVPTTLSGSEHTANTSWWNEGRKVVTRAGGADAVVADPDLLVRRVDIVAPGAFHAVAHALATLALERAPASAAAIARRALVDLVAALSALSIERNDAIRFVRGAWNAAVGLALTGPTIGAHHSLVHRLAGPGEHAVVSARLICASLIHTDVHAAALAAVPQDLVDRLIAVADVATSRQIGDSRDWDQRVVETLPEPHRRDASVILEAAAR
jgi:alcohol dehydrogenase class IV